MKIDCTEDYLQLTPLQLEERQLYLDGVKTVKELPNSNLQEQREASYRILQDSLDKISSGEGLEFVEE